jgi:DNA-binding transcriptional regulator YiaG
MKAVKKISETEIKRKLVTDADHPERWEEPITVPPSGAPRPEWYGRPKQIIRAREKSGLSQAQFAALLGVSVRTLQHWEQGRREPSAAAKTLIKIAELHPRLLKKIAA